MGGKDKDAVGGILFGALFVGLLLPHGFGWFGYGFTLVCHLMRDAASHREGPSRTTTFLAGTQPKNFEFTVLGASLALAVGMFAGMMMDRPKSKENKAKSKTKDTRGEAPTADADLEAQNGEGPKPPPYTASKIDNCIDAPQVTLDGDDMVINCSGWRVVIKKQ